MPVEKLGRLLIVEDAWIAAVGAAPPRVALASVASAPGGPLSPGRPPPSLMAFFDGLSERGGCSAADARNALEFRARPHQRVMYASLVS